MSELDISTSIIGYKKDWEVLIEEGILLMRDYDFYTKTIIGTCTVYVDVNERLVVATGKPRWHQTNASYVNEEYFYRHSDTYEIHNVEGMANFPNTKLLCRMTNGNRIWTRSIDDHYMMNFNYYVDSKSRQASVIEILADLENPIVAAPLRKTGECGSLQELIESLGFQEHMDDILENKQ